MRLMTFSDSKPEREKVAFPIMPLPYRSHEPVNYYGSANQRIIARRKALADAPYKKNDLVFINIGSNEAPEIRLGRVIMAFAEALETKGYLIPKWRVQLVTKDGFWSAQWRYCWPGDIYRAYFQEKSGGEAIPRNLPTVVRYMTDLRPIF